MLVALEYLYGYLLLLSYVVLCGVSVRVCVCVVCVCQFACVCVVRVLVWVMFRLLRVFEYLEYSYEYLLLVNDVVWCGVSVRVCV